MAKMTFKQFTVAAGGTPQPLVATTTSAAVTAPATGVSYGVGNALPQPAPVSIPVVDSSLFTQGGYCWIDTLGNAERLEVRSIADGTHIGLNIKKNHASGVFVTPCIPCSAVYLQSKPGNAAVLDVFYYRNAFKAADSFGLGSLAPAKTGLILAIAQLEQVTAPTQPIDLSSANNFGANTDGLEYYWVDGTTSDGYLPSVDCT